MYTALWEIRDIEVLLLIEARRGYLGLLSVAGIARRISATLVLMVGVMLGGARIIRDSSVFTDLLLLWLCVERSLFECPETEREQQLELGVTDVVMTGYPISIGSCWDEELWCVSLSPFLLFEFVNQSFHL